MDFFQHSALSSMNGLILSYDHETTRVLSTVNVSGFLINVLNLAGTYSEHAQLSFQGYSINV